MKYNISLEKFEGPFDLLYHLIEKNEIDIYDIPIYEITEQYMAYIEEMEKMDLEVTSEFIVMASTLLHIKSRMLLPVTKSESEQLELDEIDPRDELVKKLIEYKKYKIAAEELKTKESQQFKVLFKPREEIEVEEDETSFYESLNMNNLVKAFEKVLKKAKKSDVKIDIHNIQRDEITIEESMKRIKEMMLEKTHIKFEELFEEEMSKSVLVTMFLALLELIKNKFVKVFQENNFDEIEIHLVDREEDTNG